MIKSVFRYLSLFFLSVFVLVNIILVFLGVTSIFFTAIVYAGIWMVLLCLIKKVVTPEKQKNYKLLAATLLLSLFAGELIFTFIIKADDRREHNWCFTAFPFGGPEVEDLINKYLKGMKDLRLRNGDPHEVEINNQPEFKYEHRYNSDGFRGKDFSTDTSLINIVTLGDSYTEGSGTPGDSTWPLLLEQKLNLKAESKGKVQCINGGIRGTDPFFEFIMLKELLLKYNPKVVLVAVNKTDITDVVRQGGWERFAADGSMQRGRPLPWWYFLYQSSATARYIIHSYYHNNWLLVSNEQYQTEEKNAILKIENCIAGDYLKLARDHHFKLVVVLHPMESELENNHFELEDVAQYLNKNKEIETVNLFDEFKARKSATGFEYKSIYWPKDGHNNSTGYNLWAEILSDKLSNKISRN